MSYDVVIIGAGLSGLAAGIRLAYFGKKVCILEKHSRIGGLNSYYAKNGYTFDDGLHAITNYARRGEKSKPLLRLLRQLRIDYDELNLSPQIRSTVKFKGTELQFTNDFEVLQSEIASKFPSQIDGFLKLLSHIKNYNELSLEGTFHSTREVLRTFISAPLLTDMLLCPLMFYGNPKEDDMDFWLFTIMFKSIFLEGFARPYSGIVPILTMLQEKYQKCGGELCLKKGVRKIKSNTDESLTIELEAGELLETKKVISSAGYAETMRLCEEIVPSQKIKPGAMSFMESIYLLDKPPASIGICDTIIFYNDNEKFNYKKPAALIDERSGVICCANNFMYDQPLKENMIRITNISNSDLWEKTDKNRYEKQKDDCMNKSLLSAIKYAGDFQQNIIFKDSFTPKTIEKYTSHINGAVYGIEDKVRNGMTDINNLYICGTDQGFLGIIGSMLSGITVANLYALK